MRAVFNIWFVVIPLGLAYVVIRLLQRRRRLG
jgi:hypothetical protein